MEGKELLHLYIECESHVWGPTGTWGCWQSGAQPAQPQQQHSNTLQVPAPACCLCMALPCASSNRSPAPLQVSGGRCDTWAQPHRVFWSASALLGTILGAGTTRERKPPSRNQFGFSTARYNSPASESDRISPPEFPSALRNWKGKTLPNKARY